MTDTIINLPKGWTVRYLAETPDGIDGFVLSSPRKNGVRSNTAFFSDGKRPLEQFVYDLMIENLSFNRSEQ